MNDTCFVIMPIGTQTYNNAKYTEDELKNKYDSLIKEAISKAKPDMQVLRADDIAVPGSITSDIFNRLMYSTYVIADISLPNPNVFYELGLRHAIRSRTILLKDKNINNSVFDISHLRYIEYENTTQGLKDLSEKLKKSFQYYENSITVSPDNQFLELAAFQKYQYPIFRDVEEEKKKQQQSMLAVLRPFMNSPELFSLLLDDSISQDEKDKKIREYMVCNPEMISSLLSALLETGMIR